MTVETNPDKTVEDRIIAAIKSGDAKMHSRTYFVLQAVLLAVSVIVLAACVVYLASFIIYVLTANGGLSAVRFGVGGWYLFLKALPWMLLVVGVALIVILSVLLRRYSFVYHYPVIYAFLGIVIVVALGGALVAGTSLNARLAASNSEGVLYRYYGTQAIEGIYRGQVTTIGQNGFVMVNGGGVASPVVLTTNTSFIGTDAVHIGDNVAVFGSRDSSGAIKAFGVQDLSTSFVSPVK